MRKSSMLPVAVAVGVPFLVSLGQLSGLSAQIESEQREGRSLQDLRTLFAANGEELIMIIDQVQAYVAAAVRPKNFEEMSEGTLRVHLAVIEGDSIRSLSSDVDRIWNSYTITGQWLRLANPEGAIDGFIWSTFEPIEGFTWSVVYKQVGTEFIITYRDPVGVCQPATLHDVNGDGTLEVIRRATDVPPSMGGRQDAAPSWCADSFCLDPLLGQFGEVPSWSEVLVWRDGWQESPDVPSEFYRDQAEFYAEVRQWLEGHADTKGWCGPDLLERLTRWELVARQLAGQ